MENIHNSQWVNVSYHEYTHDILIFLDDWYNNKLSIILDFSFLTRAKGVGGLP